MKDNSWVPKGQRGGSFTMKAPTAYSQRGGGISPKSLRGLGKLGLLGMANAGLQHYFPDGPVSKANDRGLRLIDEGAQAFGLPSGGLDRAIASIETPALRTAAGLANEMVLDPFVTVLGAGASVGDWISENAGNLGDRFVTPGFRGRGNMVYDEAGNLVELPARSRPTGRRAGNGLSGRYKGLLSG